MGLTLCHVWLSRMNWTASWVYAAIGALIAGAPLFLSGVSAYSSTSPQGDVTVRQLLTIPVTAALVSVVFWGVAVRMSPATNHEGTKSRERVRPLSL